MRALLDTHVLLWIVLGSRRVNEFPWLERYRPWGVSPISLLEIQFLSEIGRIEVESGFQEALASDPRFEIDEAPLASLIKAALPLGWTRDPFDRLLVAHSSLRRAPFCTVDRAIRANHRLLPPELVAP